MTTNPAELRSRATRPRRTVPLVLDGKLRDRIEAVKASLETKASDRRITTRSTESNRQLAELHAAAAESTLRVVLEGLPSTAWNALVAEHPPRLDSDGKPIAGDRAGFNLDTFGRAAARACVIGHRPDPDPESTVVEPLDEEYIDWLIGWITSRQMQELFQAAFDANRDDDFIPLPDGPYATPASADA